MTVKRIRALRDFTWAGVKAGALGGWIESAELESGRPRLSENAWVADDAEVYGNAHISGTALITGHARIYGDAWVTGYAWVHANARVYKTAMVTSGWIGGNARVTEAERM